MHPPIHAAPIAYDVGMNNGDDTAYYLAKGYRVVAIEADPALCAQAQDRFAAEIREKRATIVNLGVAAAPGVLTFYRHSNPVLSTFAPPAERVSRAALRDPAGFTEMPIEVRRLSDIVSFHGTAEFIKIDVEGYDALCLRDLDQRGIRPRFLSAEAHTVETFCCLVAMGYRHFKMVAGARVHGDFARHPITRVNGDVITHGFQAHSAGPFGDDLPGAWAGPDEILRLWLGRGEGWFDLHAMASD